MTRSGGYPSRGRTIALRSFLFTVLMLASPPTLLMMLVLLKANGYCEGPTRKVIVAAQNFIALVKPLMMFSNVVVVTLTRINRNIA